jgi:soluble lytic murein transglycosylase
MLGSARGVSLPPAGLRNLAARATHHETWPLLRSYAKSQTDHEWRGWAYFLAGYQEFGGQLYPQAAQDLAQAAQSGFSLADYAVFYQASALREANRAADAAAVLQDFAVRFPASHLRYRVLELRASALLTAEQPHPAIDALAAEPETHKQPALALLLGQAYLQAHNPEEAATIFKNLYYNFPLSSQAKAAGDALPALRQELGIAYQQPDVGLRRARADALSAAGRYDDALKEFDGLMKDEPSSPMLPYWQLGQARCFLRMHRATDALQALAIHFAAPDLEAQRLALLVRVHVQLMDAPAITQDLAQLEASYALYPSYADALSGAGIYYYQDFNWQEAARAYGRLWELFPQNDRLREDGWRLAWCDYLLGDPKTPDVMQRYLMLFPDSARAPAALYWLGRTQENQGSLAEARALYALLTKRFVHSYYAPQAAARMAAISAKQGSLQAADGSLGAPRAAALIPVLAPPVTPPGLACLATAPSDAARPALILQALDLNDLEEDFLKASLSAENPPAELRVLLARVYAAQKDPAAALFSAQRAVPTYPQMAFSDLPKEMWDFLYPQAYWKLVQSQARLNKLDPYLVMGLIRQESAFSPRALSGADARGLMQLLPETAAHSSRPSRTRNAKRRLFDPNYNVRVGCAYLAGLLKEFSSQPELAMAAYNAGDFRVKNWTSKYAFSDPNVFVESIPFLATRVYVEQVLRDAEIYRQLLKGSPHFARCSAAQLPTPSGAKRVGHREQ